MSTFARRRLVNEFKSFQTEGAGLSKTLTVCLTNKIDIIFKVNESNLFLWSAVIFGPDDTEWEGAVFHLTMEFTEEYPTKPPTVVFIHPRMFHPNIYLNGKICLDILGTGWTQAYNSLAIMKSIQVLFNFSLSYIDAPDRS
jgi:ubiquitin-conjugating enzyme E2 A